MKIDLANAKKVTVVATSARFINGKYVEKKNTLNFINDGKQVIINGIEHNHVLEEVHICLGANLDFKSKGRHGIQYFSGIVNSVSFNV